MTTIIKFIFCFFIISNSVLADTNNKAAYELYKELRCLVCQNQSLLESNAPLALDLKKVVMDKIELGQSKNEIKKFLVDRYGEFILLKPKYSIQNILLWLGPILFLLIGFFVTFVFLRKQSMYKEEPLPLTNEEENSLKKILDNNVS
ncbi:MAG: cytochrome c-type biogenesis protein CcmH [Pelagibacterales bacterium]|nr:cytochrome c-type biogenesis protein CcmH [Pelagibacterales bacterium]|tara:strand:+ start:41 stop:481 length:441 start_codon:yes stop_codon:yes gene_type:complete